MRHAFRHLIGSVLGFAVIAVSAAPITTDGVFVYRDNEGPNTIGSGQGDNLTVVVRQVNPNLTTFGSATNPQVNGSIGLSNLFTSAFGFFNRTFAGDSTGQGGIATAPWTVTLQNVSGGTSNTLTVNTNSLAGVGQLPLLSNLTVSSLSPLAPTLSWDPVVTTTPYDQIRLNIYDNRSNQIIVTERLIGGPGTTSYTVPLGTLAPNTDYAFRIYLWDSSGQNGVSVNRSSTHINFTTTSPQVSAGSVFVAGNGSAGPLNLVAGANTYPNSSINIGLNGPGSAALKSGTTLSGTFLNVGTNNLGTLIIDNTTVTMRGGTVALPAQQTQTLGGFVTVGREAGGRGHLDVINGGQLLIDSNNLAGAGLNIGREAGSFGSVSVDGANSKILIVGPTSTLPTASDNGLINVGRAGDGRLNITNGGSVVNDADGVMNIGRDAGSRGSVIVSGAGSELNAGSALNIGPAGEGSLVIRDGATVRAGNTTLGPLGYLAGCNGGTLVSTLTVAGGILAPGCSPGTLTIIGDLIFNDGLMLLEAFGPDQIDKILVQGKILIGADAEIAILLGFDPTAILSFFEATGGIEVDEGFTGPSVFAQFGSNAPVGSLVQMQIGGRTFEVLVQGANVPEPGILALLGIGLAGIAALRRRRN